MAYTTDSYSTNNNLTMFFWGADNVLSSPQHQPWLFTFHQMVLEEATSATALPQQQIAASAYFNIK
eukprot:1068870-Amphidinium_carterae.1